MSARGAVRRPESQCRNYPPVIHSLSTVPMRNETLRVGDVVRTWWGEAKRIVRIDPHEHPNSRTHFAIAYFDDGFGITLHRNCTTDVVQEPAA